MTTDDRARTVPLPDGDERIAQDVTGAENVVGSGEWPSPSTPPSGPSADDGGDDRTGPPGREDEPLLKDMLAENPVAGGSQSVPDAPDDPAAG